jgi:hypothetical protein
VDTAALARGEWRRDTALGERTLREAVDCQGNRVKSCLWLADGWRRDSLGC